MESHFIPYSEALALKELGFDEECFAYYDVDEGYSTGHAFCYSDMTNQPEKGCLAPLYQQAFRWLLKKHNLYGVIIPTITMCWTFKTMIVIENMIEVPPYKLVDGTDYNTYEESEVACLRKLIEILKS